MTFLSQIKSIFASIIRIKEVAFTKETVIP